MNKITFVYIDPQEDFWPEASPTIAERLAKSAAALALTNDTHQPEDSYGVAQERPTFSQLVADLLAHEPCIVIGCVHEYGHGGAHSTEELAVVEERSRPEVTDEDIA